MPTNPGTGRLSALREALQHASALRCAKDDTPGVTLPRRRRRHQPASRSAGRRAGAFASGASPQSPCCNDGAQAPGEATDRDHRGRDPRARPGGSARGTDGTGRFPSRRAAPSACGPHDDPIRSLERPSSAAFSACSPPPVPIGRIFATAEGCPGPGDHAPRVGVTAAPDPTRPDP